MSLLITVQCHSKHRTAPSAAKIKRWVNLILQDHCQEGEITLRIINKRESAALNARYRKKTGPTNVLSFVYQMDPVLGDIALCAPLIAQQAPERNKSVEAHWAHLITHGCLHLLGYDHVKKQEAKIMEALEIHLLKKLGFSNPYA